ncbi:hypothetical protein ACJX0J_006230, partial [Zea mays]
MSIITCHFYMTSCPLNIKHVDMYGIAAIYIVLNLSLVLVMLSISVSLIIDCVCANIYHFSSRCYYFRNILHAFSILAVMYSDQFFS